MSVKKIFRVRKILSMSSKFVETNSFFFYCYGHITPKSYYELGIKKVNIKSSFLKKNMGNLPFKQLWSGNISLFELSKDSLDSMSCSDLKKLKDFLKTQSVFSVLSFGKTVSVSLFITFLSVLENQKARYSNFKLYGDSLESVFVLDTTRVLENHVSQSISSIKNPVVSLAGTIGSLVKLFLLVF